MTPRLLRGLLHASVFVVGAWLQPLTARDVLDFPVTSSSPDRVVVPMKMRNGVPTIPCAINDAKVWMILDTGSERCVLEAEMARKAGVRVMERTVGRVEMEGTHGKEIAAVGVPQSMAVGAWHWQGLPCVVRAARKSTTPQWLSGPSVDFNILGCDALQAMCSYVSIDYARCEVVFGFRNAFRPADAATAWQQPCEFRQGVPLVQVRHAGLQWMALVDTGASGQLELNQGYAGQLDPRNQALWLNALHLGLGGTGGARLRKIKCVILPSITCFGRDWRKAEAMLVENESKIGSGLCRGFRLTVDYTHGRIWVEAPAARAR